MGFQENQEINILLSGIFSSPLLTSTYQLVYLSVVQTIILCVKNVVDQQMTFHLSTVWILKGP